MTAVRTALAAPAGQWPSGTAAAGAVQVDELLFIGGQSAGDAHGAFSAVRELLAEAGSGFDDVVELMSFHSDPRDIPETLETGRAFLSPGREPAWTAVGMTGTADPRARVVLRAIAVLGDAPKICETPEGNDWYSGYPVSASCRKGELVFIAGQCATLPADAAAPPDGHSDQARAAYAKIAALSSLHGGSLADVIDVLSFHRDARGMVDAAPVFEKEFFGDVRPGEASALTTIGTTGLIDARLLGQYRAILDLTPAARVSRTPETVWWRHLPISGVTRKQQGRLVGISGQVASDGDGDIVFPGDPAAQARYAFGQIDAGLRLLGGSIRDVVEVTAFHKDPRWCGVAAEVGAEFFGATGAAWTAVGTTGLFKEGYLHEIHALAVLDREAS